MASRVKTGIPSSMFRSRVKQVDFQSLSRCLEAAACPMSVHEVLGMMTAYASMPVKVNPIFRILELFEEMEFGLGSNSVALLADLMHAYSDIAERLNAGERIDFADADSERIREWCRGYVDTTSREGVEGVEDWRVLVPFWMLSDRLKEEPHWDELSDPFLDELEEVKDDWRANLPDLILDVHEYWKEDCIEDTRPLAEESARVSVRRKEPKVGRNAPCSCGSGKKYKKCCGKLY